MLQKSLVVVSVLLLACLTLAAEKVKLNGYIIDNMCAGHHGKEANVEEVVKNHKTSCALMDGCSESGYALFAGGKFYKLDSSGSEKAMALLKKTKSKNGLAVQVEGTVEGDTLTVSSISEASPPSQQ